MNELTQEIHTYLTTASGSHFLNREVTIVAQWEGSDNLLWRVDCDGQEAAVKYYPDAGQARGRRQFDGQERFYPLGIAPQPLWFDRYPVGLSRQVLIYQWLPGEALNPTNHTLLMRFAQSVAQIHSGEPTEVRRFSPNPVNLDYLWRVLHGGLPQLRQWLEKQAASALLTLLAELVVNAQALVEVALPLWEGVAPTPVHGDLNLENVVDSFGTVILLDWEMFGLGDAAYDVATFLQMSQQELDDTSRELWLESYLATFAQPKLAQRIAVYGRILPLQNLCYLLHGLRQRTPQDAAAIRENRIFFEATLTAAFMQATAALNVQSTIAQQEIAKLIAE